MCERTGEDTDYAGTTRCRPEETGVSFDLTGHTLPYRAAFPFLNKLCTRFFSLGSQHMSVSSVWNTFLCLQVSI